MAKEIFKFSNNLFPFLAPGNILALTFVFFNYSLRNMVTLQPFKTLIFRRIVPLIFAFTLKLQ